MTKLANTQTRILTAAAQSPSGQIQVPEGADKAVSSLIRRGLLLSITRPDEPMRLEITDAGRKALGDEPAPLDDALEAEAAPPAPKPTPKGKIGTVLALLRRPEGATIDAMRAATGWQAHSVRGALSGAIRKNLGLAVTSEKVEGVRVYRLASEAQA